MMLGNESADAKRITDTATENRWVWADTSPSVLRLTREDAEIKVEFAIGKAFGPTANGSAFAAFVKFSDGELRAIAAGDLAKVDVTVTDMVCRWLQGERTSYFDVTTPQQRR